MRVLGGGRGGDRLKAQNGRDGNDIRVLGGVDTTKHTHTWEDLLQGGAGGGIHLEKGNSYRGNLWTTRRVRSIYLFEHSR